MAFTAETVEEQKKHTFAKNAFHFDRNRGDRTHDVTLVRSIELDPATMVPQPTGEVAFPGVIRVHFMPEATDYARGKIRRALADAIPGKLGGSDRDPWFVFTPESGVVTREMVSDTLRVLHENDAIVLPDVVAASRKIGLKAEFDKTQGDRQRNLAGLHDPNKAKEDQQVADLIASLRKPSNGRSRS